MTRSLTSTQRDGWFGSLLLLPAPMRASASAPEAGGRQKGSASATTIEEGAGAKSGGVAEVRHAPLIATFFTPASMAEEDAMPRRRHAGVRTSSSAAAGAVAPAFGFSLLFSWLSSLGYRPARPLLSLSPLSTPSPSPACPRSPCILTPNLSIRPPAQKLSNVADR
jgi:hypothetical protein